MAIYNSINNATGLGVGNTILGEGAGNATYNTVSCFDNLYVGKYSGKSMSLSSSENVCVGPHAGEMIDASGGNTLFGAYSGTKIGLGNANISIGPHCLENLTDGNLNICAGYQAGTGFTSTESSNICIGHVGLTGANNTIRIGTNGTGPGQQNDCKIAGITNNLISDATSKYLMVIDPDTTIQSISQQDITSPIVTIYNTPGTFTWTKNANTKYVKGYVWNGGHGGGSGRKSVSGTNGGGGGGGAGSCATFEGPSIFFGATETVVVGAGGAGGAGVSIDSTDGNDGELGEVSSFGNITPQIVNGTPGGGGTTSGGTPGTSGSLYLNFGEWLEGLPAGGGGINNSGFAGQSIDPEQQLYLMPTSGGGGASGSNIDGHVGGDGGSYLSLDGSTVTVAGGAGGTLSNDGGPGSSFASSGGITNGGTGGGGGGVGGAGGDGAQPGGGGGGSGGGSNSSLPSLNGGKGGNGLVMLIEFR